MSRRRGRPHKDFVRSHINIDADIFSQLELFIGDPRKAGLRYGALSTITNKLLRKFLEGIRTPGVDPVSYLRAYGVDIQDVEEVVSEIVGVNTTPGGSTLETR